MVRNRIGVPSVDRTCPHCKETFDTKRGLKKHLKNKIKVGCRRAGVKQELIREKASRERHFDKADSKPLPSALPSMASKRRQGTNISPDAKQIYVNVFDYFHNEEKLSKDEVKLKLHFVSVNAFVKTDS